MIHDLTDKQVKMLDKMWSIDSTEELNEWRNTLSIEDRNMSITLMDMIIVDHIDNLIEDDETFHDVYSLINDIFHGK